MQCSSPVIDFYEVHLRILPFLFLTFLSGISPSTTSQVVHSAGRRFIVSPVPESRLKEQFFGTPSANTSFGDEPGERKVCFIPCEIKLFSGTENCQGGEPNEVEPWQGTKQSVMEK